MEEPANKLVEGTQEAHSEVPNFSFEFLRDKLEYFDIKADFFENQNLILNEIIHKVEMKGIELSKEKQELTDKLTEKSEVKKNLVKILEGLQNQRKVKTHKKNGFYHCPECSYKTKWENGSLKVHINAVHRKLKPWKCLDCTKSKSIRTYHLINFIK